jgi:hypothetical protein
MQDCKHNLTVTARHAQRVELPELIDEKQVSKLFGISLNTLRSWRNCGDGPDFYKLGKARRSPVRYDVAVLAEWLRAHLRVQKARATAEEKHVAL